MSDTAPPLNEAQRIARSMLEAGIAKHRAGDLDGAMEDYRQVLVISPKHPDAFYLMGLVHHSRGAHGQAADLIEYALGINPRQPEYALDLGKVRAAQDRWVDAAAAFRTAIALRPNYVAAHCNLSAALMWQGRDAAAEEAARAGLAIDDEDALSWNALGQVLHHQGRKAEAAAAWEKAIALKPDMSEAHFNLATSRLAAEDFVRGWMDFGWRTQNDPDNVTAPEFGVPSWRGESLRGKTILLWGERDLGEQVLFTSLIPDLLAQGARILLVVAPRLVTLIARSFENVTVLPHGAPLSDIVADYCTPLDGLAAHLRAKATQFPRHSGFLRADPALAVELRARYRRLAGSGRLIGISWRSAQRRTGPFKSTDLAQEWGAVLRTPGAAFVNLQYGPTDNALAEASAAHGVTIHHDATIRASEDVDGWAAQIAAVDLVVAVSNTAVHLAGAMNRPVWTLSATGAGQPWYWFEGSQSSPWYPSMRLYRQAKPGGWGEVLDRVAADLALWVNN